MNTLVWLVNEGILPVISGEIGHSASHVPAHVYKINSTYSVGAWILGCTWLSLYIKEYMVLMPSKDVSHF